MRIHIESDGVDVYVVVDGEKIARRGYPNTPQARRWVSLKPGFEVLDIVENGKGAIEVLIDGRAAIH